MTSKQRPDDDAHATELLPSSYASWRFCIERKCGIALAAPYVRERLRVLSDRRAEETRRFAAIYGDAHLAQVLAWFRRAAAELGLADGET
jgi:hypothetical protein